MKFLSVLFLSSFILLSSGKVVEWTTPMTHDFGDLIEGEPATFHFQFKNISEEPIVIESVRPQCGCTAPEWNFTPIEPDSIGTLSITYDADKTGYFNKKVKVYFSGQRKAEKIYVEGFVEE